MTYRPERDENGMIPCNCCRNGKRKNMVTKEKYICNYCKGTQIRKAPPHYKSQKQIDEEEAKYESQPYNLSELEEELLEALEYCVTAFDLLDFNIPQCNNKDTIIYKDAITAIAKAKGV